MRIDPVTFIQKIVGDPTLSPAQMAVVKSVYGMHLSREEKEVFCQYTGRTRYPEKPFNDVIVLAGRRSGKSKLAAYLGLYEILEGKHEECLSPGEKGHVSCFSPTLRQSQQVIGYVKGAIGNNPALQSKIVKELSEEVFLSNRLVFGAYVSNSRSLRGFSIPCCVLDESCFFQVGEGPNADREIINAIRPGMSQFKNPRLLIISSPYVKNGQVWEDFQKFYGEDNAPVLIWRIPTRVMNTSISKEFLEKEQARDPDAFRREYEAEFIDSVSNFLPAQAVDNCVAKGCFGLSYNERFHYTAALDAGFRHDAFVFAVAHRDGNDKIIFDRIEGWRGTRDRPVLMKDAVANIVRVLNEYQVFSISGDQYCSQPLREAFAAQGIGFNEVPFTSALKREIFSSLKDRIMSEEIELLDHPESVKELKSLELRRMPSGNVAIGAPQLPSYHDDYAVTIALAAFKVKTYNSMLSEVTSEHLFAFQN
jgi:hypothetical protein